MENSGNVQVLDSSALLAHFEGEIGGSRVREILKSAAEKEAPLLISVVNWGEVLYIIEGRYGPERRDEIERLMAQMRLEIVEADQELTRLAVHFKAAKKLPYGDSFCAALAFAKKAELVTSDRDFRFVEREIRILWV